jgi:hypothetical protein
MASARRWVDGLAGGGGSVVPNTAGHVLAGSGWGLAFGLVLGRRRPPGPAKGAAFGGVVWLASLVELPALGVAPPPWRRSPAALGRDLGFHLVYGTATAATYEAFSA